MKTTKVVLAAAAAMLMAVPALASDRVKMFIADLHSETGEVRSGAALALGEAGDPRAVKPLQGLLKDEYMDARKSAAWALGELGDKTSAKPLSDLLKTDKAPQVRVAAASSLGKIRVGTTAGNLKDALGDQDASVRAASVEALASVSGNAAAGDVEGALKDENWSVRCSALNALGSLKDEKSADTIASILGNDDNELVRAGAAHALGKIGVSDDKIVAALRNALKDGSERVRGEALAALGNIGESIDGDTRTATTPDKSHTVQQSNDPVEL